MSGVQTRTPHATADEWREHQPHWGVVEFEVYGDELGDSLISDAPIWLEGGEAMSALDEEVTLKEFADRYEWLSPLYASDEAFEAMMRAAWKLK